MSKAGLIWSSSFPPPPPMPYPLGRLAAVNLQAAVLVAFILINPEQKRGRDRHVCTSLRVMWSLWSRRETDMLWKYCPMSRKLIKWLIDQWIDFFFIYRESCRAVKSVFCLEHLAKLEGMELEVKLQKTVSLLNLPDCMSLPSKRDRTADCIESDHHGYSPFKVRGEAFLTWQSCSSSNLVCLLFIPLLFWLHSLLYDRYNT